MGLLMVLRRSVSVSMLMLVAMATHVMADSATDAKGLYRNVLAPHLGSKDKVNRNLTAPLVGGDKLTSASGQTSFDSKAFKASGSPFMRVSAFLNVPTGDLTGITVEQDLNMDGTLETVSVFPKSAGGRLIPTVCADGYAQCNPGTFENCQYRKWVADSSGKIDVVVAGSANPSETKGSVNSLSSCFCFSNACSKQNNSAIINLSGVISDIGGGIAAAVLASRKDVAITSIQSADMGTIIYYGVKSDAAKGGEKTLMTAQQAEAMPNMPSTDLVDVQNIYRDAPGGLTGMGDAAKDAQINDPNSLYNTVSGALNRQAGQRYTCANQRDAWLDLKQYVQTLETNMNGVPLAGSLCTDHFVEQVFKADPETGKFSIGWRDTSPSGALGLNCGGVPYNSILGVNAHFAGTIAVTPPAESAGYRINKATSFMTLTGGGCSSGNGNLVWVNGITEPLVGRTSVECPSSDAQWPSYSFRVSAEIDSQELVESTTRGCKQYEERSDCRLQQEMWDGRPSYLNFMPTGFQMYQFCKEFSGPVRNTKVCRDWWRQEKVYICKNNSAPYDFTGVQQRAKEIQDSAGIPSSGTLICTDKGTPLNFQIPANGPPGVCQQVCKTKVPFVATVVTPDGARSSNQVEEALAKDSWKIYYKDCEEGATGAFTCPVDSSIGEIVVTNCACGNDFSEALGAITTIDQAAKDSICSKN